MNRRGFFVGSAVALLTAPAIVRVAANLMPISVQAQSLRESLILDWMEISARVWAKHQIRELEKANALLAEISGATGLMHGLTLHVSH